MHECTDIYRQMESAAEQERLRKILQKRPQLRTQNEVEKLMERTVEVQMQAL